MKGKFYICNQLKFYYSHLNQFLLNNYNLLKFFLNLYIFYRNSFNLPTYRISCINNKFSRKYNHKVKRFLCSLQQQTTKLILACTYKGEKLRWV